MDEIKTDKELIELAKSLYTANFILDYFSSHDLREYDYTINELEKRGYIIREEKHLLISNNEEEEED